MTKIEKFEITRSLKFQLSDMPTKKIAHVYLVDSYGNIIETFEHFDKKSGIINFVSTYDRIIHFNSDIFAKFIDTSTSITPVACYTFMVVYKVEDGKSIDVYENATQFERLVHDVYKETNSCLQSMSMFNIIKIVQNQFKVVKGWDENVCVDKKKG